MRIWSSNKVEDIENNIRKVLEIVVYGIIACGVIIIIYVLHCALGNPFVPLKEYRGVSFCSSDEYTLMEDGELFFDVYHSLPYFEECEITDFYHIDKATYDSIFHGKVADLYALKLKATDSYDKVKDEVIAQGTYIGYISDGNGTTVEYYLLTGVCEDVSNRFVAAFGEEPEHVCFYLVTDYDDKDVNSRYQEIANLIWRNIPFDWVAPTTDVK